jgi:hypothetical protein
MSQRSSIQAHTLQGNLLRGANPRNGCVGYWLSGRPETEQISTQRWGLRDVVKWQGRQPPIIGNKLYLFQNSILSIVVQ